MASAIASRSSEKPLAIIDHDHDREQETGAEAPVEHAATPVVAEPRHPRRILRALITPFYKLAYGIGKFLDFTIFSSLTRRIMVLNLAGLLVLVVGILYLNQWRAGLIDARVQSLRVQ